MNEHLAETHIMKIRHPSAFFAAVLMLAALPAAAEDIELFVNHNPEAQPPNVLFVIDNAANFDSNAPGESCIIDGVETDLSGRVGGIEQCALYTVISALPEDSVRIGIMVYNANGVVDHLAVPCVGDSARPGGCLGYPITLMTAANKTTLLNWIKAWKRAGSGAGYIKGNAENTGGSMQEAWAYYAGRTGLSGRNYSLIKPPEACNQYIIFVGNSFTSSATPGDQTGNKGPKDALEGTNPSALMNAYPAATTSQRVIINRTITTSCGTATLGNPHEAKGYYADEWSRYLNAQGITTYTIGVLRYGASSANSCQPEYSGTLTSMADVGGGKYFPTTNYDELVTAFQTALSEMLSVNSVFASVSLPVSVNTEGTYLNQVYIGMFRPDADVLPRWHGNLKQYRLGRVGNDLKLLDAQADPGQPAISTAGTGFISSCALSYWTPTVDDTYWAEIGTANCEPHAASSNTRDGNIVEKGAQGYVLRGLATATETPPTAPWIPRNLKTCGSSACTAMADFATGNTAITQALLGAADSAERTTLIEWARGRNNRTDEDTYVAETATRPTAHGDVVHSRPIAINFAASDTPAEVVVFYGGNDGVLRAVNGNRTLAITDDDANTIATAGEEFWAFMPPEFYPSIKRLRDNDTQIEFDAPDEGQNKPYGLDGPITAYRTPDADPVNPAPPETMWIFSAMRRGGRAVYAFDVSDITSDPDSVSLMWKFGCPNMSDDTGCSTADASGIGQTWASLKSLKTQGHTSGDPATTAPMLIMGGGYDVCEDEDPDNCSASSKGRHIYVLDAETGTLLKTFDTDRPVVGDVFVIPDGDSGLVKWAYAVDTGGNVYRISGVDANSPFGATAPADWTITKIASLGCDTVTACDNNRKFLFGPDVVWDEDFSNYVIMVGSGDREKPVYTYTGAYNVDNYFFMLRDAPTDATWLTSENANCSSNDLLCLNSLFEIDSNDTPSTDDLATKKGWYLHLADHEQIVTSAITVFGVTTFSSHIPTPEVDPDDEDICTSDLGTANVYNVRFANAAPGNPDAENRFEEIAGGGLPPSPVAGLVKLDDGTIVPFLIGGDPTSALEGKLPTAPVLSSRPKSHTYWFIEK